MQVAFAIATCKLEDEFDFGGLAKLAEARGRDGSLVRLQGPRL
jgi:hypothetical protein